MRYDEQAVLIAETYTVNSAGDSVPTQTRKTVWVCVKSVGLKRKLEAEQSGLKIDLKFILPDRIEYADEPVIEYGSVKYNVVSVFYAEDNTVELSAKRF